MDDKQKMRLDVDLNIASADLNPIFYIQQFVYNAVKVFLLIVLVFISIAIGYFILFALIAHAFLFFYSKSAAHAHSDSQITDVC